MNEPVPGSLWRRNSFDFHGGKAVRPGEVVLVRRVSRGVFRNQIVRFRRNPAPCNAYATMHWDLELFLQRYESVPVGFTGGDGI